MASSLRCACAVLTARLPCAVRFRYLLDLSTPYGKMVCAELIYLAEVKQVSCQLVVEVALGAYDVTTAQLAVVLQGMHGRDDLVMEIR
jgi:hypothetical protein